VGRVVFFLNSCVNKAKFVFVHRLHDRKICVLGLCMLLDTTGNRPQEITSIAGDIIPACIMLFDGLKRAYQCKLIPHSLRS